MSSASARQGTGERFRNSGYWLDQTVDQLLIDAATKTPQKVAIVADRMDRDQRQRITYRQLLIRVDRVAQSLKNLGISKGDVVTMQLPNWWEFVVVAIACNRIGAVINPVMPILRERELLYILNTCAAKVFIVPKTYRGFEYAAMAQGMRAELPHLKHLIVVDGDDETNFERLLLNPQPSEGLENSSRALHPDDMALLMFTSGTTGEPKGVVHTSNSLIASAQGQTARCSLATHDVLLVASPASHITGYVGIVLLSIYLGATMVLQDVWEPKRGVALMTQEGVTFTAASTPFLVDVCDVVKAGAPRPESLRTFLCGGAPIPPILVQHAASELGISVVSAWGMTETLAGTVVELSRAADKASTTDGCPVGGMEVRIVDFEGRPLPVGQSGRLLVRGPHMFKGYYKKTDLQTFDADGWFDSGDLAYIDDDGYIRISGRVKDVLIRAGENVPVVEIENLLYKHPGVADVAIVGYPDTRVGERGCAFIVPRRDVKIDLASVQDHLAQCKAAKQYWPERVELVASLPRTASGKIQKFKLKEIALAFGDLERSKSFG
jgi:cyclohexanecarboxylate-CoA ligase